ncbi:hypothetical protein ACHAXN_006645 [Cyclotella atomus]
MATENPQSTPSSAEEAAALLGAAISFGDAPLTQNESSGHPNPPAGMHSIFAVQSPVPNGVLFVKLCNLREWLRWHAGDEMSADGVEDPLKQALQVSFPKHNKDPKEPFTAARSILAVLLKLLEVTSSISDTGEDNKPLAGIGSPKTQQKRPVKQHRALPPLLSTPLRTVWVHCVALCISLGSSLPGNQRTDVYAFITKMMDIANMNPRSKLASGGVRHAALEVIQRVCTLNTEMAKRSAPYAWEILQCCHRGLMSGGTGEPGHRAQCVKVACGLMIACRRASKSGDEETFMVPGALEEKAAVEAIKFMKRAVSDKYPEVRMAAAVFTGLAAPMLIRNVSVMRKDSDGVSPLVWLEDVTQVAMKNLDDESAGVATAWAQSLARCLCASVEFGKSVRDAQSEDQASKRSADVDDEGIAVDNNNLDFAGKFKAFSEARRAAAATSVCSSSLAAVKYLVSNFVKVGGEGANNKCGGSFSVGGRASRIGFSLVLTEFLRLQCAKGEFSLAEFLLPVLDMVGPSFEKQVDRSEHKKSPSMTTNDLFAAPSSPYSSPEKKVQPSISTAFLTKGSKISSSDSTIGRLLTTIVVRRGISENISEISQLSILKDLTTACRVSIVPVGMDGSSDPSRPANSEHGKVLNRHQLQVALVEMSHLIITLGEAGAASLDDITQVLKDCLAHRDHGVRMEAATVYTAIAQAFPTEGRKFVIESLSGFGANMDAIQTLAMRSAAETMSTPKGRFRKGVQENNETGSRLLDELMQHQCHMHGNALTVSMLMHAFPHVLGGIPRVIVDKTYDVCEKLLQCQSNDAFVNANPSAACPCIRAGYSMLSGMFTMGVDSVLEHVTTIFSQWQASSMNVLPGVSKQSPSHDILIVEGMLSSVVSFLKYCPTLLLSVPDALNRITSLLEKILPLLSSGGKFDSGGTSIENARLSNSRSAIMEAYSWLPPGSFPLSADRIFTFSAKQIQDLSVDDVTCSILTRLLNREDNLIEAQSSQRTVSPGQSGLSSVVDTVVSIRTCDVVTTYERETVFNLVSWRKNSPVVGESNQYHGSVILGSFLHEENYKPTPLHEVGTWRQPLDPIPTVRVRLLDSSIHVFAATFGLQDPHTQSDALRMLESLYISTQTDKSNRFNVNATLITDSQGKVRPLEEDAITFNVTAVVLACLQAIPLHEATYGNLIGRGPPWMERATSILLQLISSQSDHIRRGAAEGLSFLATLGVSEDANTLQSTILHALDEVMKGSNITQNQKTSVDLTSFGRAGSLLSLACIQRNAKRIERSKIDRATSRSVAHTHESKESDENAPPVLIMMTRLLPTLATHSPDLDSSVVRSHAIHAFGILIANSFPKPDQSLSEEQKQIAWKAIEAVETSFLGAWSAVTFDYNKGRERDKFASEPALVAVVFRLMTTLLPWLPQLADIDRWTASRFCCIASSMVECCEHPIVLFEAGVFFESLFSRSKLVQPSNCCVVRTNDIVAIAMPYLIGAIGPGLTRVVSENVEFSDYKTPMLQRSAMMCLSRMCSRTEQPDGFPFNIRSSIFVFLHDLCGRRRFQLISDLRSLAQSTVQCEHFNDLLALETDTVSLIHSVLISQASNLQDDSTLSDLVKWLLFSRYMTSGISGKRGEDNITSSSVEAITNHYHTIAQSEVLSALRFSNPPRWQLKAMATDIEFVNMNLLLSMDRNNSRDQSIFNLPWAKTKCNEVLKEGNSDTSKAIPYPAFFMEELVLSACSAAAATSNHSEIISVQTAGIKLLCAIIEAFGDMPDLTTNDGSMVLEQYSSQIISALKHSLKSEISEDSIASGYHLLFSSGCDALLALIKKNFVSDPVALKRLLKTVMLSAEDAVFIKFPNEEHSQISALVTNPRCVTDDLRAYPSFRLSKLCFIATLSMMVAYNEISQSAASVIAKELHINEEGRAILMAASAIDGFLLQKETKNTSGFTYKNRMDLDAVVIEELVANWPTLCASATLSLIEQIKIADEQSDKAHVLAAWLQKVAAIAFVGLKALLTISKKQSAGNAHHCVYAIRLLVRESSSICHGIIQTSEISDAITLVTYSVINPALVFVENESNAENTSLHLLKQSCGLLEDASQYVTELSLLSVLHRSVLNPLSSLQEGKLRMGGNIDIGITSCIRSSIYLLRASSGSDRDGLEKALLHFALSKLVKSKSDEQSSVVDAECISLLKACTENSVLPADDWQQITTFAAANRIWDAWSILVSTLAPGVGIECSMHSFKKSFGDLNISSRNHNSALVAFRGELQIAIGSNPSLVGAALHSLGFEVFQLFKYNAVNMHGGSNNSAHDRLQVCAECIQIVMMAYQYLTSVSIEETKYVEFLVSLSDLLVETISFNGLPNSPSGKSGADERIGKMCAQVFVHIARTTPHIFKSTVTAVMPECRSAIEAAVRADMSGYISTSQGPAKKKLSLKGFVR